MPFFMREVASTTRMKNNITDQVYTDRELARVSLLFCVLTYARVSSRHPTHHAKLLWQVSSFEFSGKSIGKTVFEREKMHILQN